MAKKARSLYIATGWDQRYKVSEEEWKSLPKQVQQEVNDLRDLVWQFSHAFKNSAPPGALERSFWTQGVVRKTVLLHISTLYYEDKQKIQLLDETREFCKK